MSVEITPSGFSSIRVYCSQSDIHKDSATFTDVGDELILQSCTKTPGDKIYISKFDAQKLGEALIKWSNQ